MHWNRDDALGYMGLSAYCIFIAMNVAILACEVLDVHIKAGQCIEFIVSIILYDLLLKITPWKYSVNEKKFLDDNSSFKIKINSFVFFIYAIAAMGIASIVMYFFDVHLSRANNVQAALEMLAIYSYQSFMNRFSGVE